MKLNHVANTVEMGNVATGPTNFSISMNAKAFKVLSDTLYQDKPGSIVRELSCNAYDSHVMAGKTDVPFEIHVPTDFEPWFSVKDYGTGLTPDAMYNVFTKYFESTKDNSNDVIGAFGLGSKSWASYTDQATITSITDGVKRVYSAFISSSGLPALTELAATETKESNGVELMINIRKENYRDFAKAIASQLRFFTVKPKIVNDSQFKFEQIDSELEIQTDSIDVRKAKSSYLHSIFVIQGQVGYPLDVNIVSNALSQKYKEEIAFLKEMQNAGTIHLYFNIGEIEVTASRESISYTTFTFDNIAKKLAKAKAELLAEVKNKIDNFVLEWDAASFINSNPFVARMARAVKLDVKGLSLVGNNYVFDGRSICADYTDPNKPKMIYRIQSYTKANPRGSIYSGFQLTPMENSVLMVRDTAKSPIARVNEYVDKYNVTAFVFNDAKGDTQFSDATIKKLSEVYGGIEIIRISDLDLNVKPRTPRVRGSYVKSTFYNVLSNSSTSIRSWDKQVSALEDIKDKVLYTTFENNYIKLTVSELSQYACLKSMGRCNYELIAVKPDNLKKLNNGIAADKWIAAEWDKLQKDPRIQEYSNLENKVSAYGRDVVNGFTDFLQTNAASIANCPELLRYITDMEADKAKLLNMQQDKGTMQLLSNVARVPPDAVTAGEIALISARSKLLSNKYALFGAISYWRTNEFAEHIIKYINSVAF